MNPRSPRLVWAGTLLVLSSCGGDGSGPTENDGPAVASVTVLPAVDSIIIGDTAQFRAEARDSAGTLIAGRPVTWRVFTSPSSPKLTVNQSGVVTAIGLGLGFSSRTEVTAAVDGVSGTATIFLVVGPLSQLSLTPQAVVTVPGGPVDFLAAARDSFGNGVPSTVVTWSVEGPATVEPEDLGTSLYGTVEASVTVTAVGTATVRAAAGEKAASATVTATLVDFTSVSVGGSVSCGLTTAAGAFCWGGNYYGSLGAGFSGGASLPLGVTGSLPFKQIVPGFTSCGLTVDGATYCWGGVANGLFTPDTTVEVDRFPRPVRTAEGVSFAELARGVFSSHACGLTTSGQAYCWGWGRTLGDGGTQNAPVPTPVAVAGGLTFTSLNVGPIFTCGTIASGAAWCWGDNDLGQLGNGDTTVRYAPTPVAVTGGLAFTQVAVGDQHACGIVGSGTAYCWGRNGAGELGTTTNEVCVTGPGSFLPCSSSPVPVSGGLAFRAIAANSSRTCALATDGTAYCWPAPDGPTAVTKAIHFSTLSVGQSHACGLADDGLVYCWGDNSGLQLGVNGQPIEPVPVAGQQ